ncbi:MAG: histidine kinase [Propioniciclava sp.]|uniref:sensor histidine kinase n=1 Tax=Propioniciclava sp. TaxID=2038686 RepID=UPI0039E4FDB2
MTRASWRPPAPRLEDVVLALGVALLVFFGGLFAGYPFGVAPLTGVVWGALYVLPVLWRRADPDLSALALIPAHLLQLALVHVPTPGNVTVPLALFTVAAYGRRRWRVWWLVFGLAAAVIAVLDWRTTSEPVSVLVGMVGMALLVATSWAAGAYVGARGEAKVATADVAQSHQVQYAQAAQLAATQERQNLAREMHDIVAHSLAVIVVQADGGAYAASAEGPLEQRLATAERALTTIRTTAHEALSETRRLVGVLRSDQPTEMAPNAGLGDIFALVQGLSTAGRDVRMRVTGDVTLRRHLSPTLELAAYRVVQEALTNAVKHAGDDAAVLVHLHHSPDLLSVTVRDTGRGTQPSDGRGHGLIGMNERVTALGGTLSAHDHPDGGFVVTAHLPTPQAGVL